MNHRFGRVKRIVLAAGALLLLGRPLSAQYWDERVGEFSLMSGGVVGGLGTHPILSGSAGAYFSRYIMGLLEASVVPMNNQTLLPPNAPYIKGSDLFDFNFGLQGQVPFKRWAPYGSFGLAVLMNPYKAGLETPAGTVAFQGERHSKFGLELGGGCRFFVRDYWGIRAEYRYTSSSVNFNRVLVGVFYQLQGDWPFAFVSGVGRRFRR